MKYEAKLPNISHRAIYDLLNKLTNRRPVKTSGSDLFRDLIEINDSPRSIGLNEKNLIKLRINTTFKENYLASNKKVLKPIQNYEEKQRLSKLISEVKNFFPRNCSFI